MRSRRLTRLLGLAVLAWAAFMVVIGCGSRFTRTPVDFARARCALGHDPIVVDAKLTSPGEWAGAASVPFRQEGRASFLWDDKGVYGFLRSPHRIGSDTAGCLCIAFTSITGQQHPQARLYMGTISTPTVGAEARLLRAALGTGFESPAPDASLVQFAGTALPVSKRGEPWDAEFFLSWKALTEDGTPPEKLWIHVFRIMGERPYSVLKWDRAASANRE